MSIGFDRDRVRRQRELTKYKNIKGKNHVSVMLRVKFGFAEHRDKATYSYGFDLTITRSIDNSALNKAAATNSAKTKINSIE